MNTIGICKCGKTRLFDNTSCENCERLEVGKLVYRNCLYHHEDPYADIQLLSLVTIDEIASWSFHKHGDIHMINGHLYIWEEDIRHLYGYNLDKRKFWGSEMEKDYQRQQEQRAKWGNNVIDSRTGWYPVSFEGENI
jgi:hypothetical protein